MNSTEVIKQIDLDNGLSAVVQDQTKHYFGGYYHVSLQIVAEIPVTDKAFENAAEYEDALRRLGRSVPFSRALEKMAVLAEEVDSVRAQLLEAFENNMVAYLSHPDFASRFIRTEYQKQIKTSAGAYRS